jgi:prepilin-type N-terminal cleavage/methylation domain-containing protein
MDLRRAFRSNGCRAGFSLPELLIVIVILGIVSSIAAPKISTVIRHQRVNKAAALVAADLQNVFAMAGRQRAPVHLASDAPSQSYTFSDRKSGAVLQTRSLGSTSEYQIGTLTFSPAVVDMFPNGISSAPLTVTIGTGDYTRTVTASTAGFVRVVP